MFTVTRQIDNRDFGVVKQNAFFPLKNPHIWEGWGLLKIIMTFLFKSENIMIKTNKHFITFLNEFLFEYQKYD